MASLRMITLFPEFLFANGDRGNRLCLARRLAWRGIACEETMVAFGETVDLRDADLVLLGGGEEHDACAFSEMLTQGAGEAIRGAAEEGIVFFCTGGGFSLLGESVEQKNGKTVAGIGALPMITTYEEEKILGNYAFHLVEELGGDQIVGFENHHARTVLGDGLSPLGYVEKGQGNNGKDRTEGAWYQNVFGTYCQGPILPKHPALCDLVLQRALDRKYGSFTLEPLDDHVEEEAHQIMWERVQQGTAERDQ